MRGATASLFYGFLKGTLVHRHAFIPSLTRTREIGCGARVPASFDPAVSASIPESQALEKRVASGRWAQALDGLPAGPRSRALGGLLHLYDDSRPEGPRLQDLLDRYAAPKGLRELEAVRKNWPEWWPGLVWQGLACLRRCDFDKARKTLDALVAARPDWSWSYLLRSELGRVDIEFKAALEDLARAEKLEPGNAWLYALRSRVRFQMGPDCAALEDLDRAVALDPRAGWMRAWRGDARRKLGDQKGALEDLLMARALEPDYDRTYLWLGKVLHAAGLEKKALAALNEGLKRCPHFEKAFAERSRVLRKLGRVKEALVDLDRAARVNHRHNWLGNWTVEPAPLRAEQRDSLTALDGLVKRSARALAWRGESKMQAGDVAGGLVDLDAALRRSPRLAWAYAWRGEAHFRSGETGKALADLDYAVRLDPAYGRAYAWRGRLRHTQGRYAQAVADLDRAVGDSLVEYSWLYHWRAQAYEAWGKSEQSRQDARTALALEPGRPEFQLLGAA